MKIKIVCTSCRREMIVHGAHSSPLNELEIEVDPCDCGAKCENCEDVVNWKIRAEAAEHRLVEVGQILSEDEETNDETNK